MYAADVCLNSSITQKSITSFWKWLWHPDTRTIKLQHLLLHLLTPRMRCAHASAYFSIRSCSVNTLHSCDTCSCPSHLLHHHYTTFYKTRPHTRTNTYTSAKKKKSHRCRNKERSSTWVPLRVHVRKLASLPTLDSEPNFLHICLKIMMKITCLITLDARQYLQQGKVFTTHVLWKKIAVSNCEWISQCAF